MDSVLFNDYYRKIDAVFEMVKCMIGRESVFLDGKTAIRGLKIHSFDFLKQKIRMYSFGKIYFPNIYISIAHMNNMPLFKEQLNEERYEQLKLFRGSVDNFVTGYDFPLDFDLKDNDFKKLKKEVTLVSDFLVKNNVPFSLRCSGSGFHIIIYDEYFNFIQKDDKIDFYKFFAKSLTEIFKLETLDYKIIQKRCLIKCPYSFDTKTNRICYPLNIYELKRFEYKDIEVKNILIKNLRDRGVPSYMPKKVSKTFIKKMFESEIYKNYLIKLKEGIENGK